MVGIGTLDADHFASRGVSETAWESKLVYVLMRKSGYRFARKGNLRGMVLAETGELLLAFSRIHGCEKVSIAEIGSLDRKTLEAQLTQSMQEGANCAFVVKSVQNGKTKLHVIRPAGAEERALFEFEAEEL